MTFLVNLLHYFLFIGNIVDIATGGIAYVIQRLTCDEIYISRELLSLCSQKIQKKAANNMIKMGICFLITLDFYKLQIFIE
jgi:hypothetical protein